MCGIGGILRTDGKPIPEEWLDAIDTRIGYRGPDGAGRFRDRVEFTDEQGVRRVVEVAFVHRRLSIIDHADGAQPMVSERGRNESEGLVAVVFNGCIYNHRELRKELEAKGHRFVTDHSDTEVLIHGWREWRETLPDRLEGMYAFVVWDRTRKAVFLSRDLFGEKPLYTRWPSSSHERAPDWIEFCSDRRSLASVTDDLRNTVRAKTLIARYLQRGCMWGEFTGFIPGPRVDHHSAGKALHFGVGTVRYGGRGPFGKGEVAATASDIEILIDTAVARRLEADVRLGCFLSGGVDSSIIAHFAKKHKPDLMTFCVRMPDPRYDESKHAEAVAKHLGTNHRALDVAMKPAEDLVHLIDILGQPFGDSSILPTYWVSKAAREHVKVALSGDGGDELFVGYERYLAARKIDRHHNVFRHLPAWLHARAHPRSIRSKLARLGDVARDYPFLGVRSLEALFPLPDIAAVVGNTVDLPLTEDPATFSDDQVRFLIERVAERTGNIDMSKLLPEKDYDALEHLRRIDVLEYLPRDLLTKTDTASMAVALEVRCPYLDRDLARAVLAMPIERLIPGGERKGLLKQIARKYLPRECVDRPKMGFAIPIGEWFRDDDKPHKGAGMKTLLLDHLNSAEPFGPIQLNRKAVQRFIDEHLSGRRDHSHRLFTLLTLSIWAKGK